MVDRTKLPRLLLSLLAPAAAALAFGVATGCSQGTEAENIADPNATDKQLPGNGGYDACALPNENCPCSTPNETVACGEVTQKSGDYVWCSPGTRTCEPRNGEARWGACNADRSISKKVNVPGASKGTADLAVAPGPCESNPCDPYCLSYSDDPTCFDADGGSDARWSGSDNLDISDNGITIAPCGPDGGSISGDGGTGGGGCTLTVTSAVSPPTDTITVTSNTPWATTPPSLDYTATFVPAGCLPDGFNVLWTVDRQDLATIDTSGKLKVFAPVAGPIIVTAYVGTLTATATANVRVNITETVDGDPTKFTGAVTGSDTFTVLYPYNETLFPLGIVPPNIQWTNGNTANQVKTTLVYPAGDPNPIFSWARVRKETNPARDKPTQAAWDALSLTAQNKQAGYTIQRYTGGQLKPETPRTVRFANGPLRGHIYYTEYKKHTIVAGQNIAAADDTTTIRKVDPGTTGSPVDPFKVADAQSPRGCPACHSISSQGNIFATSARGNRANADASYRGGDNGGLSLIDSTGMLARIADYVGAKPAGNQDWRGFAWAPLTPDGKYALGANNIWGNTTETIPDGVVVGNGTGTGLIGLYYGLKTYPGFFTNNLTRTRIDPTIDFDWNGTSPWPGIIPNHNFSGNGTYPCENWSATWTGYLVPPTTETYTFETLGDDGVVLIIDGNPVINQWHYPQDYSPKADGINGKARSAGVSLTAGVPVSIQIRYFQEYYGSQLHLKWSTPTIPLQVIPTSAMYPAIPSSMGATVGTGLLGSYYDQETYPANFTSSLKSSQLDPTINFKWGGAAPGPASIPATNWSARWVGYLMAPTSETYTFQVQGDDGVQLIIDGTTVINQWQYPQNYSPKADGVDGRARGTLNLTAGKLVPIEIRYFQELAGSQLSLSWSSPSTPLQIIPTTQLYPVQPGASPSGNGLQAVYYDNNSQFEYFTGQAWPKIDPQVDFTEPVSGTFPPNTAKYEDPVYSGPGKSSIFFSARWVGQVSPPCTGTYKFWTYSDDGARLWIDGAQVIEAWDDRAWYSSRDLKLTAGQKYDLQLDYWQGGGPGAMRLHWSADCGGLNSRTVVSSSYLTPTFSGTKVNSPPLYPRNMSNGGDYDVWSISDVVGTNPTKVTTQFSGLAGKTMMVPAFAHDGTRLAFINGTGTGLSNDENRPGYANTGWRKGLSVFAFDQTTKTFSNQRLLRDTYHSCDDVMKWPTWESDSRSIIFQTSTPNDRCDSKGDNCQAWYGHMAPTNYYRAPGRLWSIDADNPGSPTSSSAVLLDNLNFDEFNGFNGRTGEKAFQPTALPVTAGGYRWVVFTSTRPYGNTANLAGTDIACVGSQLWVSALDDKPNDGSDRSHRAFWLPNQGILDNPNTNACVDHYTNERAFWVLDACTANGQTCQVNEDCCGGTASPPTAVCRLNVPVNTSNPTRSCAALNNPVGVCTANGNACNASIDCCGFSGGTSQCIGGLCQTPPSLPTAPSTSITPGTFTRDYEAVCPSGTNGVWRFFDGQTVTPGDSTITFAVQTADTPAGLGSAASVALGSASGNTTLTSADVGLALSTMGQVSKRWLRITVGLNPGADAWMLPTLTKWKQEYSCMPSE